MHRIRIDLYNAWLLLRLGRVHFLVPGAFLYLLGALLAVLAGASLYLPRLLLGYMVFMPAHLSVSYSNDLFDADTDRYGRPTPFSGGSGVLVSHPHLRPTAGRIAIGLIVASFVVGIVFMAVYAYPAWLLAYLALGNALGWFYAAPPLRLSYRGLGEIATTLTVGLLVPALGYIMTTGRPGHLLWAVIPGSLLCGMAFIIAVQIPDLEADRRALKHTLVSRIGRGPAFILITVVLSLTTVWFLALSDSRLRPVGLFGLLPAGISLWSGLRRPSERESATRHVSGILIALVGFLMLTDGYLLWRLGVI
jgi:1,4-dihydroxy-2-naphthoate octaprenyltransferase